MNLSDDQIKKVMGSIDSASASDSKPIISGLTELGTKAFDAIKPTAPGSFVSTDELYLRLDNLAIPEAMRIQAEAAFEAESFTVCEGLATDLMYKTTKRLYTRASRPDGVCLAVLHVPPQIFPVKSIVMALWPMIANIEGHIRFVAADLEAPNLIFNNFIMFAGQQGKQIIFVPWTWFQEFLKKAAPTEQVFSLPEPAIVAKPPTGAAAVKPAPPSYPPLAEKDRDALVTIFMERALVNAQFFDTLVNDSDWSIDLKTEMAAGLTPDAKANALHVLEHLANWNRYAAPPERVGDTYLGWVLLRLLKILGNPTGQDVAHIILDYQLVSRDEALKAARDRLNSGN